MTLLTSFFAWNSRSALAPDFSLAQLSLSILLIGAIRAFVNLTRSATGSRIFNPLCPPETWISGYFWAAESITT